MAILSPSQRHPKIDSLVDQSSSIPNSRLAVPKPALSSNTDTDHKSHSHGLSLTKLTSLAPKYYAYLYLACLPLFAWLYKLLPCVAFNHADLSSRFLTLPLSWSNTVFSAP